MDLILSLFPLALAVAIFGGVVKLAAKLLKRTKVTWAQGVNLGIILLVVTVIKRVIDMQTMISMPPVLGFLMGTLAALSIGAWYLGKRARNLEGEAIGLRNGLKLAGISIGIVFALGIVSTAVVQTLIPQ